MIAANLRPGIVDLLLGEAWIDDEDDAVDRQGRLGDVRRDDDLARVCRRGNKDFSLRVGRERRVQRQGHDLLSTSSRPGSAITRSLWISPVSL